MRKRQIIAAINFITMNDYLNTNLKSLIEKVHDEGIEKANEKAQRIIADAKRQSDELLKETEQRIAGMEAQSANELNRMRENLNSELKAAAQQTMNTIKDELADVISNRIASQGISEALNETAFLQKIILTVLQKWNPVETNFQFELLLNKDDEVQLKEFFEQRIKKELATELEIVVENKIKCGFKVGVKNENYYVDFSGDEFENFFKGYLRKKTVEWIYGTKETSHE
jgi:V/A-type H+-transporting ATPase subunit E